MLFILFILFISSFAAVGNLNIAKDPTKTYQQTAGFGTYFSDSSFFCDGFKNLGSSKGMYFAINGIVGYPANDFSQKFCGKCIAVQAKNGNIIAPVQLIDVCDPSNCDYSDGGHLDFLNNNGNKAYKAIDQSTDVYEGNPKFTWWWLPSCDANPQQGGGQPVPQVSPVPKSPPATPKSPAPTPKTNPVPVAKPVPASKPVPVAKPVPASKPVPVAKPVAAPSDGSGCSEWKVATMSGYDNLDGSDDMNPSCLNDFCGTTDAFLNAHPAASILASDWNTYKFHKVQIQRSDGKIGTAEIWDECVNSDCPNQKSDPTCCTTNAKAFGGSFLLDIDRHALKNLFGITNYDDTWEKVNYRICEAFDPNPIVQQYKLKGGRVAGDDGSDSPSGSGLSTPGIVGIVVGCVAFIVIVGLVVFFVITKKSESETV